MFRKSERDVLKDRRWGNEILGRDERKNLRQKLVAIWYKWKY